MSKKIGKSTIILENKPAIVGYGSVVGKFEKEGPIGEEFDSFDLDARFGEESFEKAESRMQKIAIETALKKSNMNEKDVDIIFAGDLLNQCIGSTFGIRNTEIPYIGVYGACSTMALSLSLASIFVDSKVVDCACAVTSSHFCSAERQYRFPLEYGSIRPQTAQRTVTGSGATILKSENNKPYINSVTIGKIVDFGIKDANNMGAAMAPVSVKLRLQARGAEARPGLARRLFPLFSCSLLTGDRLPASAHFALRKNSVAQTRSSRKDINFFFCRTVSAPQA